MIMDLAPKSIVPGSPQYLGSDPTAVLRDALVSFENVLSTEQKQQLHAVSPAPDAGSVIQFITRIDAGNKSRGRRCVAPRLCSFLDSTQQFASVVGTFVDSNPALAALIWGSVKLAILAASNIFSYFDKVTSFIMNIGKFCPAYQKFGYLFPDCMELQSALCEYYGVVIRLSTKIIEVMQKSSVVQVLSSVLRPFELEFKPFLEKIEQAAKGVQLSITLASQLSAQESVREQRLHHNWATAFRKAARKEFTRSDQWRNEQAEKEVRRLRLSIKENLSSINHVKPWKQAQRERIPGTAEWIQRESAFLAWRGSRESATLWCSGTMGVGKTMLASQIVARLFESREQSDIVAYYFCRADYRESLSARSILGSLARQILDLYIENVPLGQLKELHRNSKDLDEQGTTEFICAHLSSNLAYFVVLDGYDECEEIEVRKVGASVEQLQRAVRLKVFFSGRPDTETFLPRSAWPTFKIHVTREKNNSDLNHYIDVKLQEYLESEQLILSNIGLIVNVAKALEEGSDGM